jgi:ABC-type phosphate transport system permease subunit
LIDRIGDPVLKAITFIAAALAVTVLVLIAYELIKGSRLAFRHFGLGFLTSQVWDDIHGQFGALSLIFGTVVTAVLAILIAAPLAIAIALFLTELAPKPVRALLGAVSGASSCSGRSSRTNSSPSWARRSVFSPSSAALTPPAAS